MNKMVTLKLVPTLVYQLHYVMHFRNGLRKVMLRVYDHNENGVGLLCSDM